MAKINFISMTCLRKQDVTGKDEPELLVDGKLIWNEVMEKKQTVSLIPLFEDFNGRESITLTLREHNSPTNHRVIGTKTVRAGHPDPQPVDFKTSGAHYQLYYSLT